MAGPRREGASGRSPQRYRPVIWARAASFTYVTRGLIGILALAGRTEPFREGESGTGWLLLLFHLNHTLHAEPAGDQRCRYSDTVDIDAGPLTGFIATLAIWVFQYRQRRWHKLVRNHLRPSGPRYATKARSEPA
jgi:hypothetical protein